jgi:ABC-2 type transport system ATP-binding protein
LPTTCGSVPAPILAGTTRWPGPGWSGSASIPTQKAGKLSGGQRAQLALTLGLAKRPELLILDEPVASLDPLARREFLQVLMEAVAEHEVSVLLSSHVVSDLERVCDHVVVLVDSQVRVEGDVEALLDSHLRLTGRAGTRPPCRPTSRSSRRATPTGRAPTSSAPTHPSSTRPGRWARLGLEDLVLAYMEGSRAVVPGPVLEVLR